MSKRCFVVCPLILWLRVYSKGIPRKQRYGGLNNFWLLMINPLFNSSVLSELQTSEKVTDVTGDSSAFKFLFRFLIKMPR